MRKILPHMALLFLLFSTSCEKTVSVPVWLNQANTLSFQDLHLSIKAEGEISEARLYTASKTFSLKIKKDENFELSIPEEVEGIIEGPAILLIDLDGEQFVYEFYLVNQIICGSERVDYRSPKTVNPDSVLEHQQIIHYIDDFRNIMQPENKPLFEEHILGLTGKSGFYEAIENEPITNYYVQPGTATKLPIAIKKEKNELGVSIGPVTDAIGNLIADGTLISIYYTSNEVEYQMQTIIRNGYASIPLNTSKEISNIYAVTNGLKSSVIEP
ncbi:hypothetical protein [Jiulongibacter sediminis]|uniref:Uncharacterized protein n=1 Tax=Jiulongibacter sediminis TaxID=1605367 RepID=A0A0P7BS97_9BACT|nr:hypothetical protein [Jiulongibacter sediminis]KPM47313.1 hypothetical protein AFM12_16110 [Jiulongibacter sediminis]TBX22870.1 hypothetical protein TK44_16120 [Jiulongibacter sediminis]